jgi:hypothetical protein
MATKHFSDGTEVDVFGWPTVGNFAMAVSGFAVAPTGIGRFMVVGHMVTVSLPALTGVSNSTEFIVAGLPAAIAPLSFRSPDCIFVIDHGKDVVGTAVVYPDGTIHIFAGPANSAFAANGTKGAQSCELNYLR